ncbi:hypothetical protein D9M71_558730 [compost metagenome]
MATFAGADLLGNPVGFLDRFQRPRRLDVEELRLGRGLQAAASSHEERQSRFVFERCDGAADGGLGNAQQLRRPGHGPVEHQRPKALELANPHLAAL